MDACACWQVLISPHMKTLYIADSAVGHLIVMYAGSGRQETAGSTGMTARQMLGQEEQLRSLQRGESLTSVPSGLRSSLRSEVKVSLRR